MSVPARHDSLFARATRRFRSGLCLGLALLAWAAGPDAVGLQQVETLEIAAPELEVVQVDGRPWTAIELTGGVIEAATGDPALPSLRLAVPIDAASRVARVEWEILDEEALDLSHPVLPYGGERSSRDLRAPSAPPNPAIYESATPYPQVRVAVVNEYVLSDGSRRAVVRVDPLQIDPAGARLLCARRARLVLVLEPLRAGAGLEREREPQDGISPGLLMAQAGFVPTDAPSLQGSPVEYIIVSPSDPAMASAWQRLADWKTASGHPAVVRTVDWIREAYPTGSDLAESIRLFLKDAYTHWGLQWALLGGDTDLVPLRYVRSWFYNPSPEGTEVACDYYYAALNGTWDADADGIFGEPKLLQGQTGGPQMGDGVDFQPQIHVGRISARTAAEVDGYLDKYFTYVQTPPDGYLNKMLMLGEVLFHAEWSRYGRGGSPDCYSEQCNTTDCRLDKYGQAICARSDGATDCFQIESALETLGNPYEITFLLERYDYWHTTPYPPTPPQRTHPQALRQTLASSLEHLSSGYNIVQHVGHGDRDRWMVGEGRILAGDLANLTNGETGRYFIVYGVNCSSAAIDYDSFGEEMVRQAEGGAVGYIGCTNVDFPGAARGYTLAFYENVLEEEGRTIGDGFFGSAATNAPTGESDGAQRFLTMTMVLLGEPGMMIWQDSALPLDLAFNAAPVLGMQDLAVTATSGGAAVAGARVCIWKGDEVYVVGETDEDGVVSLPFWPRTAGAFQVTATTGRHRPAVELGSVGSGGSGSQLVLQELGVVDDDTSGSAGNGDGVLDVGETVRLAVTVQNTGTQAAQGLSLSLSLAAGAPEGVATILDAAAAPGGGTVGAGQTSTDNEGFLLEIESLPPEAAFQGGDALLLPVDVEVGATGHAHSQRFYLEVCRPRLVIGINEQEDAGHATEDRRNLYLGVINAGKGTASGYTGKLSLAPGNAYSAVLVSQAAMADLEAGASGRVGPFLINVFSETQTWFTFEVRNAEGTRVHSRTVDLRGPAAPESLTTIGQPGAVRLTWGNAVDPGGDEILGFKVMRAEEGSSSFEAVHEGVLLDHRYINDGGLDQLAPYSYQVAAVDSGGNLGAYTPTETVYTTPGMSDGWPCRLETLYTPSSPLICELDGWWGTGREVIFGGEYIYAFHGNGTEVVDGDQVGSTAGPYSSRGLEFYGKAAAGDLNADGKIELVAVAKGPNDARMDSLFCWSGDRGRDPVWVKKLSSNVSWYSPVLANLDGSTDNRLEVIVCAGKSGAAGIYVFRYDGQRYSASDANGLLKNLGGSYLYHPPSVGDVDGDGQLEVVVATRQENGDGAVWVVRADGSTFPHFGGMLFSSLGLVANQGTTSSPTLGDVDGDGGDEIFVVTPDYILCLKNNQDRQVWERRLDARFSHEMLPEAALGDIDGDGDVDLAVIDATGRLWVLDARTGVSLAPFVDLHAPGAGTRRYGSCILANVDQDSLPEIIFGDNDRHVHAYTHEGVPARGFPIVVGGQMHQQSLAAWDVDNDGYQNLVVQADKLQQLTVLEMAGVAFRPQDNPWPMRYRDDRNSGRYRKVSVGEDWPVPAQLVLEDPFVSAEGRVGLAWFGGDEAATHFRIHRAENGGGVEELVGEIPSHAGQGGGYRFEDTPPGPGLWRYRIAPVGATGREGPGVVALVEVSGALRPLTLAFGSVVPNPLQPTRTGSRVTFALPGDPSRTVDTRLRVIDLQGRTVCTLVEGARQPGFHTVAWDGRDREGVPVPSGLYLLRLDAKESSVHHRLVVVR